VPGEGGFLGGAGSGLGANILLRANIALRDAALEVGFLVTRTFAAAFFAGGFRPAGRFEFVAAVARALFFLTTCFLTGRFFPFNDVEGLRFLPTTSFFAGEAFLAFGEAVILPGRVGFLEGAFFALVERTFPDAEERLFVVLVIRPLIGPLEIENEPAARLNPAHTLVYGLSYINNLSASQENYLFAAAEPWGK